MLNICERSLSAAQGMPMVSQSQSFVHGELLSSGYLIRPCEGRGALIIMVDHRNLEVYFVCTYRFDYCLVSILQLMYLFLRLAGFKCPWSSSSLIWVIYILCTEDDSWGKLISIEMFLFFLCLNNQFNLLWNVSIEFSTIDLFIQASHHLQAKVQPEMISLSKNLQQPCDVRSYSQRLCR